MDLIKPWYLSRTIWASIVAVMAAAGGAVGIPLDEGQQGAMTELVLHAVSAMAGLAAILGRFAATTRIL
jgi:hypothetical protein